MAYFAEYHAPIGLLVLTSDGHSLTGLWMSAHKLDTSALTEDRALPIFSAAVRWLDGYFAGKQEAVTFPLAPAGTAFQQRVWEILLTIPHGKRTTYGTIAKQLGPKMSAQAVGQAVGKNPISIVIPCHRVVGAQNQLTGYAGGLENKKWLLAHEGISYPD